MLQRDIAHSLGDKGNKFHSEGDKSVEDILLLIRAANRRGQYKEETSAVQLLSIGSSH